MQEYSKETLLICTAYNLQPENVLFAYLIAAGANISDSYRITHNIKSKVNCEESAQQAEILLKKQPGIKVLINRIKTGKTRKYIEENNQENSNTKELNESEKNGFKTRAGLVDKIITQVDTTTGKDRINALVTLAKLQNLDQPEETEETEKRTYFLPWVSNCKTCKLMQVFRNLSVK